MAVGFGFAAMSALGSVGKFASGLLSSSARQAEFAEQLRQIQMKKAQTIGIAESRAGMGGTDMGSRSTVEYLKSLTSEFDKESLYMSKAAATTGVADMLGNVSGLMGDTVNTVHGFGKLNNWKF